MFSVVKKALCFIFLIFVFAFTVSAHSEADMGCDVSDMLCFGGKILNTDEGTYYADPNYGDILFYQSGTKAEPVYEESVSCLNMKDGVLYFVQKNGTNRIYKMDTADYNAVPVSAEFHFEIKQMYVLEDSIYFSNSDSIMLLSLSQGSVTTVHNRENLISFVPVEGGFVTAAGKAEEFTVYFEGTVIAENVNSYTVKNGCVIFSKQDKEYAVSLSDLISGKINIQEYNGIGSVDISDIINENMTGDDSADSSEYIDGISLYAEKNPVKNRKETSQGVKNMLRRSEQLCSINWTPVKDIYGWNKEYTYKAGQTYSGLPYGQPVFAKYVPWSASFGEFLKAVDDPSSLMYTKYSYNGEMAPYYSIDCSAFISWVWELSERHTTVGIPTKANLISKTSFAEAKVGDCICKSGVHVVLISDITYNEKNEINSVTITEASPKKETDLCCQSTSYGEGFELTLADFMHKYFYSGYSLYRYPKAADVSYKHYCEVILESDKCNVCKVGEIDSLRPFNTTVKVTANTVNAYTKASDRSAVALTYKKGRSLKIVGYGKNAFDEVWYKLSNNYWISGEGVQYSSLNVTASVDGLSLPSGDVNFAEDPHIKGTVKSGNLIGGLKADVFSYSDLYTQPVLSAQTGKAPDGFNLENSRLDKLVDFSSLAPGKYRVTLTVSEYSYSPFIKEKVTAEKKFHSYFTVLDDPRCTSWSTKYPGMCDEQFIERERRYSCSELVTITSDKPSLKGYTLKSSKWVTDEKASRNGVISWPEGFDKQNSIYTKYDLSSLKNITTETQKTTVSVGDTVGYIYYHWCENSNLDGPANRNINKTKTSVYKMFHAFYSTKKPSDLKQIGSCYQYSNAGCCKHTYWYYAINVKKVSYTNQSKEFTYTRWTPWSVWSQTPYEKSDTLKVKTAIVYRYNDKEHIWDEGTVKTASTCSVNGISVHNCSHCDKILNQPLPLAEHEYEKAYTVDVPSSTSRSGSESRHCKNCNAKTDKKVIPLISRFVTSFKNAVYNGEAQRPYLWVYDEKGNKLTYKKDYTVKYSSGNKDIGKYSVTVSFIGRYKGTKKVNYYIIPSSPEKLKFTSSERTVSLSWAENENATGYRVYAYDSKARKYKALKTTTSTSYISTKLKAGTVYTYIVKSYKKVDGEYYWSTAAKIQTATNPLAPVIRLASTAKGRATIAWNNVTGENGYQVYYSQSKNSTYKKLSNYKANTTKVYKTGLKSGKTYYFRVRAYKKAGSGYVYSDFSSTKAVKIK